MELEAAISERRHDQRSARHPKPRQPGRRQIASSPRRKPRRRPDTLGTLPRPPDHVGRQQKNDRKRRCNFFQSRLYFQSNRYSQHHERSERVTPAAGTRAERLPQAGLPRKMLAAAASNNARSKTSPGTQRCTQPIAPRHSRQISAACRRTGMNASNVIGQAISTQRTRARNWRSADVIAGMCLSERVIAIRPFPRRSRGRQGRQCGV